MMSLAITGIGIISPIGCGTDLFWNTINSEESILMGHLDCFDLADYIGERRFRRAATVSQYGLAAAELAIQDVNRPGQLGDKSSLIMAVTHGALGYTQEFKRALLMEGPDAISPIYFSDSVLNAPAGNASICFGITGPVHTVIGGYEASVKALRMASGLIKGGKSDLALVVSAEEKNELAARCYKQIGIAPLLEGSVALCIELTADTQWCYISAISSQCDTSSPLQALNNVIAASLDEAGMSISDIQLVVTDIEDLEKTLIANVSKAGMGFFTGKSFAVGMMLNIAFAALLIRHGKVPEKLKIATGFKSEIIENVLVCCKERYGSAAAVILTKRPIGRGIH